jgi:integrase/recombinase XerD
MSQLDDYLSIRRGEWSEQTFVTYKRLLSDLAKSIPDLGSITLAEFTDWLYRPTWGDSQRYVACKAAQGFIRWAIGDHPILKLKVKRRAGPPQRSLNATQLGRLLSSFDTMCKKGVRDLAMCSLMVDTGLRATEVCSLAVSYVDLDECRLTVKVKGGKWGEGVFSDSVARYLGNWLEVRKAKPGVDAVFTHVYLGTSMTRQGLRTTIRRWGLAAGVGVLSPHDLRRTFAVLSTRNGAPARVLQTAGRWSSMAMVEQYTQAIDQDDMRPYFPVTRLGY